MSISIYNAWYILGDAGYVSDSDVCRRRANLDSGYISEGGADYFLRGRAKAEDGYRSEGGAEFYSRKVEQRLAYERERAQAEQQHRRFLEGKGAGKLPEGRAAGKGGEGRCVGKHQPLPQVLGAGDSNQVYKVVGGRRNVAKADSGKKKVI